MCYGCRVQIRASALPGFNDCARRTVARVFSREVTAAGHELRRTRPSIGAAVGTTTHAAAHVLQAARVANPALVHDELISLVPASLTLALEGFHTEIAEGVTWDDSTPNTLAAQQQIDRMVRAYLPALRTMAPPRAVELSLEAAVGDGWRLTGTLDVLTVDGHLDDLKTGYESRPYHAQLGGYSLLARANDLEVRTLGISFIERTRLRHTQRPLERQAYDLGVAERTAWQTIERVKREVGAFLETGAPDAISANPMSLMCRPNYCPAFGTSFCRLASEREPVPPDSSEQRTNT